MKYANNKDAVIIACFFNFQNNPYRVKAFYKWWETVKHLEVRVLECTYKDSPRELPNDPRITHIKTDNFYWMKESLLNIIIKKLPVKYKYVFWMDPDIIYDDPNWLVKACDKLKNECNIIQPFTYVIHMEKDEDEPSFDVEAAKKIVQEKSFNEGRRIWRSFISNWGKIPKEHKYIYYLEGVCGFIWGMKRELLDLVLLFDKAKIGSADHPISHFSVGDFPCKCIDKAFKDNLEEVYEYGNKFFNITKGKAGYLEDVTIKHIWHAPLENRQYLQRVQDWTKVGNTYTERDEKGLFKITDDQYMKDYFKKKEDVGQYEVKNMAPKQQKRSWWGWIVSVVVFIFVGPVDNGNSGY